MMIYRWSIFILCLNCRCIRLEPVGVDLTSDSINRSSDTSEFDRTQITILGALTSHEHINILNEQTNRFYSLPSNQQLYISSQSFVLDVNPLLIAIKLCEIGNESHAKAIIAGRGLDGNDLTLTAISYVSDFYHIPILTIASRENLFSDKVVETDDSLVRTTTNTSLLLF
jgi:hypothetical protein